MKIMKVLRVIITILVLVAIIGIGVIAYQTCSGNALIHRIDAEVPTAEVAPYPIYTATKIYYAEKATLNDDKSVTMTGWYENQGGKWVKESRTITLSWKLKPRIGRR